MRVNYTVCRPLLNEFKSTEHFLKGPLCIFFAASHAILQSIWIGEAF